MKEYIVRKRGSKYQVVGHKGDVKGEHNTEKEAEDQVKAIYASMNEAIGEPIASGDSREAKEIALKQLLGNEELNVEDLTDESLDVIMRRLTGMDEIEESVSTVISVMRDLKATDHDIVEALAVNLGMHLEEAEDVLHDYQLQE
jgi:hypothetical protein